MITSPTCINARGQIREHLTHHDRTSDHSQAANDEYSKQRHKKLQFSAGGWDFRHPQAADGE
jgi:hypothetical protein